MGSAESSIQRDILDWLSFKGFLAWRNHTQGIKMGGKFRVKNPNAGHPDVWAVRHGFLIGVEVKTPTGRVSADQEEWIAKAARYGVSIFVVRSVAELEKELKALTWPVLVSGNQQANKLLTEQNE